VGRFLERDDIDGHAFAKRCTDDALDRWVIDGAWHAVQSSIGPHRS
jgi:hypothetical protein